MKDELNHSGVAGMKWGVHKSRSALYKHGGKGGKLARLRYKLKKNKMKTASKSVKIERKVKNNNKPRNRMANPKNEMSTKELQDKVNRMRLEKEYHKLTTPQQSAGKKFVKDVLYNSGKSVATSGLIKAGNYYTDQFLAQKVYKSKNK